MIPFSLLSAAAIAAQTPVFPSTPAGRFMSDLVATINGGDEGAIRTFAETRLAPQAIFHLDASSYTVLLRRFHEGSGGFRVERIEGDGSTVFIRSNRDGRLFGMRGSLHADGRGVFESVHLPMGDRSPAPEFPWPVSPQGLEGAMQAVRAYLDDLAKRDKWNGTVLIAQGDRVILETTHGLADRGHRVPIRRGTRFNLASLSKMFTAVTVGQLVQEGKLALEDPLGKFRPDWPDAAAREKVTVRMLLNHTAGIPELFESPRYDPDHRYANATETTDALVGQPLTFAPGTSWSYSNGGYVMLGSIIERVTGKPFEQAVKERVFKPLGMADTGLIDAPGVAPVYDHDLLDPLGLGPKVRDRANTGSGGGPAGGGFSTAHDLFRFARALRTNRLLNPALTKAFTSETTGPGYALGFMNMDIAGQRSVGHDGHARADLGIFWDLDITVIALGNDLSEPTPMVAFKIRDYISKHKDAFHP